MKHNVDKPIHQHSWNEQFAHRSVDVACLDDLNAVVNIINQCYADIQVNIEQVIHWTQLDVFDEDLWIFVMDNKTQQPIALGIAERDKTIHEGMLEWIQVLPAYQGRKLGQAIVCELLVRLSNHVDFVTVSGQIDNTTNPEMLYRKCGFEGTDIWHVIERK